MPTATEKKKCRLCGGPAKRGSDTCASCAPWAEEIKAQTAQRIRERCPVREQARPVLRCIRCGQPKDASGAEICSSCLSGSDAVVAAFEEAKAAPERAFLAVTDWRGRVLVCMHSGGDLFVDLEDRGHKHLGSFVLDVPGMVQLRDLLNRLIPAFQDPERVPECWQRKDGDQC